MANQQNIDMLVNGASQSSGTSSTTVTEQQNVIEPVSHGSSSAETSTTAPPSSSANAATSPSHSNDNLRISWLQEAWQLPHIRYERIATGSPLVGVAVLGQSLLQHHLDLAPARWTAADFAPVRDAAGEYLGARPKLPTWPLTRKDMMRHKSW